MSAFERYLTVWVFLCTVVGVALGHLMPGLFQLIAAAEIAKVNIPVAVLIWLMIIPMLLKIDFRSLSQVGAFWRGIGVTLFINWAVKTVLDGDAGVVFPRLAVSPLSSGGSDRFLHRRVDHPCRGPMHRHGLRLEQSHPR